MKKTDDPSSAPGVVPGAAIANCEVPRVHSDCLGCSGDAHCRLHELPWFPRTKVLRSWCSTRLMSSVIKLTREMTDSSSA
jgi:hypothetical protein